MANTVYHSVIFEDASNKNNRAHTWDNWRLIPSSRPVIVQPTPVYKYVEIPGRSGSLDLSDYLTGKLTYSDRKGSLEFIAVNTLGNTRFYGARKNFNSSSEDFQQEAAKTYGDWANRRAEIAEFLDGRKMKVFLEDDPSHYYLGRVFFKEWRPDPQFSKVVIEYQLNPFKYSLTDKEAGL